MASTVPNIPVRFMAPNEKFALMNWLVEMGLPSRISRLVLEQWAEALNVDLTPTDYQLLNEHLKTGKA